ncbi:MAG: JmjC domain-containing histone demethylation protein 1 [Pleopsidium flavum]|nr:MAG: JmjC domain-containing histone demethylation protein 1 [Pleopsidium flavum]
MTTFSSFKRDITGRPPSYRTPSPPRHAVEPLSPSFAAANALWPDYGGSCSGAGKYGHTGRHQADETESELEEEVVGVPMKETEISSTGPCRTRSSSTMDAFAMIALASSPTFSSSIPQTSNRFNLPITTRWQHYHSDASERPSKRARSEKHPTPDWQRIRSGPATSHETTTDMESDAELLLYLARQPVQSPVMAISPAKHIEHRSQGRRDILEVASHSATARLQGVHDRYMHQETPNYELSQDSPATVETGIHRANADKQQPSPFSSMPAYQSPFSVSLDKWMPQDGHQVTTMMSAEDALSLKRDQDDTCIESGTIFPMGATTEEDGKPGSPQMEPSPLIHTYSSPLGQLPSVAQATCELQPKDMLDDVAAYSPNTLSAVIDAELSTSKNGVQAICATCNFTRNSLAADIDSDATSWISCDGCKRWFHFACAGFKSEREVRSVDKYSCRECKPTHGPTTYVRKSSRAHTAIDYAGLNEGVIKTSDENPEHHYIRPIKEGTIKFLPDNFPRMRPELVTAEYFEKGDGMKEPVVIPAWMNPRPASSETTPASTADTAPDVPKDDISPYPKDVVDDWFSRDYKYRYVPDHGQDALDMVIPKNLTVRRVAELYGPEEKVEVIDVKSQEGEDKKWNMRRWVDYYESKGAKKVRNVISLEVSQSKLGRLIKRPRIVRELDLQDSVWPTELQAKGDFPKVQFYCLMSVADCYTDFHIDFGGSSVFYHILKGKKTFLFIPPKEKHLKKYEEWCMSQAQNWTFLADQTKECYRVDLSEGDTMLIPSGWIHAVWTPENSLVIGGNFLTRMHYGMQIRIAQIEKATKVARKFRYPHFQKLLWYTAVRYLERDPIPLSVLKTFHSGQKFFREIPSYYEFEQWGERSKPGDENYHARYYSQYELEGLPDLARYLLRTALISMGKIADGITADTRNAVKRSIPKGHGEPLDIVKRFAMWSAWKRGNEDLPHWAQPDAVPGDDVPEPSDKKPSAAALRKLEREAAIAAYRIAPERQSARKLSQLERAHSEAAKILPDEAGYATGSPAPSFSALTSSAQELKTIASNGFETSPTRNLSTAGIKGDQLADASPMNGGSTAQRRRFKSTAKSSVLGPKRVACDKCRKRRIRCKHKDDGAKALVIATEAGLPTLLSANGNTSDLVSCETPSGKLMAGSELALDHTLANSIHRSPPGMKATARDSQIVLETKFEPQSQWTEGSSLNGHGQPTLDGNGSMQIARRVDVPGLSDLPIAGADVSMVLPATPHAIRDILSPNDGLTTVSENSSGRRSRSKACDECRKSKVRYASRLGLGILLIVTEQRRCIHDEDGNIDPIKAAEAAIPRAPGLLKKRQLSGDLDVPKRKRPRKAKDAIQTTNDPIFKPPYAALPAVMSSKFQTEGADSQDRQALLSGKAQDVNDINDAPPNGGTIELQHQSFINAWNLGAAQDSTDASTSTSNQAIPERPASEQADAVEDEIQLVATSPAPNMKLETNLMLNNLPSNSAPHNQDYSALVSPPDSSHTDAETSPSASKAQQTPSNSPSTRSSEQPKQSQRYTPESGIARRASSSTQSALTTGKSASPRTSLPPTLTDVSNKAKRVSKARASSGEASADGESLKLIRELAAQDLGLRRRGRG